MARKMKSGPKVVLGIVAIVAVVFGFRFAMTQGWIPGAKSTASSVPQASSLPNVPENVHAVAAVAAVAMPSTTPANVSAPQIRIDLWAWNSQMGQLFANGGPQTTEGSLMAKAGVNLKLQRQDDVTIMQKDLLKFAKALKAGKAQPTGGVHFVQIMGDGAAAFLKPLNGELRKLGPEYTAEIIYSNGFSRGEDKAMGPEEWKSNPQAARGGLVACVVRDGDWNIFVDWASKNGVPVNPDVTTYNPNALNFAHTDSYIQASKMYLTGYSESRPVVNDQGIRTGQTKKVTVNAVATWTPGDVMIAKEKGGLVSLLSTRENIWQMPNVVIGIKKWNADNAEYVTKMIDAALAGGDQVMKYREARRAAADISAVVYAEETGEYWYKYYSVQTEVDPQGLTVELGGSKVNNLADNLYLFGLLPGSTNLLQATYEKYGNLVVNFYPDLVPSIDPANSVINPRYLRTLAERTEQMVPAEVPTFAEGSQIREVVGKRSWNIEFETGSATFTPAAQAELNDLYQDLVLSGGLAVQINGHTDDVGDPDANMSLSERRAFAVKEYLQSRSRSNFTDARVTVHAFGETQPLLPNSSSENRAKNRRVEIIVGKAS